jgi:hypothetical protein
MDFIKNLLSKLIDPGKIGGWVRAGVAALITMAVVKLSAKIPGVEKLITPEVVDYVAVAAGTLVTGLLSNVAKA